MAHSILAQYPDYEVVIGMEIHVQLTTASKIFCTCANEISKNPNSNICPICTGHPGVLPVLNKKVVDYAILAGLATNSTITKKNTFARKHYFYPDLPKNYQITQSNDPICTNGHIPITAEDGTPKSVRLIRIHMEEDAGKNTHIPASGESLVDFNRTGTPLLEIVSYPDMSSAHEVREYLRTLHLMVQYLGICSGNMEDGAFRADTNISVRKKGAPLGTKCELKNINSFKFISDAIEYEIERQISALEDGKTIRQETRLWDTKEKKTVIMRVKEEAADYRYFDDPDLPLLDIDDSWIEKIRAQLPELPHQKHARLIKDYGLSPYEATILVEDKDLAAYAEQALTYSSGKQIINWILRDVMGYLKEHKISINDFVVTPKKLAAIINLLENNTINNHAAKEVFLEVAATGREPEIIVKEKGLEQIGSGAEMEALVNEIINANPQSVADYKAGKEKLFGFFVGQVMAKTQGKGNPKVIQELLKKHLR